MKKKEPVLAQVISVALHPLFMAVYGVALLFLYTDSYASLSSIFQLLIPIIILTCILPANAIFLLKHFGLIQDYQLKEKRERFLPFLITFFCYLLLIYYYAQGLTPLWFISLLIAPLLLLVLAAFISYFWKISAHMIGIGGLIGSVLSICYNVKGINPYVLFIILFILAGCLGVSRLILKRHTPAQVYVGFVLGSIVSYLCIWFVASGSLKTIFY